MLYHKEVGFPKSLFIPGMCLKLTYTKHANERLMNTPIRITPPASALLLMKDIIEVKSENNIDATKVVLRTKYNNIYDLVLIIEPNFKTGFAKVITLWLNDFRDTHKTLDKSLYDTPKIPA